MRNRLFYSILAVFLLVASQVSADELKKMSIEDWQALDRTDKIDYMMRATDALQMKDVPLSKSTDEYLDEVDAALKTHPEYTVMNVADVLELAVSENEPEAKEVLDKLRNSPPADTVTPS